MTPEEKRRLFDIFGAHSNGTMSEAESRELQESLRASAQARRLWFLHNDVEQRLYSFTSSPPAEPLVALSSRDTPVSASGVATSFTSRAKWSSFGGVLAGLVVGALCSSIIWAFALPQIIAAPATIWEKVPLWQESFEDPELSWPGGFPSNSEQWGGHPAKVVPSNEKAQPIDGRHMLRLEPCVKGVLGRVVYVVDLKHNPVPSQGGTLQLELRGDFHPAVEGKETRYNLRAAAFAEGTGEINPDWMEHLWLDIDQHSVAHAATGSTAGADAEGWQRYTLTIEIPPTARRLAVSFGALTRSPGDPIAYYLDKVQASFLVKPSVP